MPRGALRVMASPVGACDLKHGPQRRPWSRYIIAYMATRQRASVFRPASFASQPALCEGGLACLRTSAICVVLRRMRLLRPGFLAEDNLKLNPTAGMPSAGTH